VIVHVTQVSPTTYSRKSVIGGGEKGTLYVDHALRRAAAASGTALSTSILSFGDQAGIDYIDHDVEVAVVAGRPWSAASIRASDLIAHLERADVLYINQCLSPVSLFVAAQGRLLGRRIIGVDSGGGEDPLILKTPDLAHVYDAFHAQSQFAVTCFSAFDVPVHVVPGPLDTDTYTPDPRRERNRGHVLAVGRILPHKGFDRIVRCLPHSLALTIVGRPYDEPYCAYLRELARGKDVSIETELDDAAVRDLLHRAGLFIHASTAFDYRGWYTPKPELLGLAPLEAIASGLLTLVSDAGALPELARLPGCWCFADDTELAKLLVMYANGELTQPDPAVMYAAVDASYGNFVFGRGLLEMFRLV
jgi:glycosyltransferase involved in cell wall biosynthesis